MIALAMSNRRCKLNKLKTFISTSSSNITNRLTRIVDLFLFLSFATYLNQYVRLQRPHTQPENIHTKKEHTMAEPNAASNRFEMK